MSSSPDGATPQGDVDTMVNGVERLLTFLSFLHAIFFVYYRNE